jgi:hypothetical protein
VPIQEPEPAASIRCWITARIAADYPRWLVWYHEPGGLYYARRRGRFRVEYESGAPRYFITADNPAGLRALLAAEDAKPPPDGWDC